MPELQFEMNAIQADSRPGSAKKVSFCLPNLEHGGAEKTTVHLANGLAERGYCVDMVLFEARGEFLSEIRPPVRIVDLKAPRTINAVRPLARYFDKIRPSVVISALDHVNVGTAFAQVLSASNVPIIMTVHTTQSMAARYRRGFRPRFVRWISRWCYRRAAAIVCVSQGVADDLVASAGANRERVRVIYNPAFSPRILDMAREEIDHPWFCPGAPPVVLAVGRLTPPKDYSTLIRAVAATRSGRDIRLLILGEGEERPRLEKEIAELGLQDCVALPGFTANPYAYMARAAIYVLSSISEALPTVLIEALAVGMPIVATDCPSGPREVLQGGRYGTLVPVGNVAALAKAIAATLQAPRSQPPTEAVQPFSADRALIEYSRLIAEVGKKQG
jgi:glycosyltransferase involved in cell wall biosynthesis